MKERKKERKKRGRREVSKRMKSMSRALLTLLRLKWALRQAKKHFSLQKLFSWSPMRREKRRTPSLWHHTHTIITFCTSSTASVWEREWEGVGKEREREGLGWYYSDKPREIMDKLRASVSVTECVCNRRGIMAWLPPWVCKSVCVCVCVCLCESVYIGVE